MKFLRRFSLHRLSAERIRQLHNKAMALAFAAGAAALFYFSIHAQRTGTAYGLVLLCSLCLVCAIGYATTEDE